MVAILCLHIKICYTKCIDCYNLRFLSQAVEKYKNDDDDLNDDYWNEAEGDDDEYYCKGTISKLIYSQDFQELNTSIEMVKR